jgi:hypothetical protein
MLFSGLVLLASQLEVASILAIVAQSASVAWRILKSRDLRFESAMMTDEEEE